MYEYNYIVKLYEYTCSYRLGFADSTRCSFHARCHILLAGRCRLLGLSVRRRVGIAAAVKWLPFAHLRVEAAAAHRAVRQRKLRKLDLPDMGCWHKL